MQNKDKKTTVKNQPTKNVQKNNESFMKILGYTYGVLSAFFEKKLTEKEAFEMILGVFQAKINTTKKERTAPVSVLNDIFKDFAKEQFEKNNEHANEIEYDNLKAESLEFNKAWFEQNKVDISSGKTEKLLKHLGIVKDGIVNLDSLETAVKSARLLLDFSENLDDRLFILPGLEIQVDQLYRLHRIARGL